MAKTKKTKEQVQAPVVVTAPKRRASPRGAPAAPAATVSPATPRGARNPKGKRCRAKSKTTGERCKQPAMQDRDVCRYHGGKSPRGLASPNFKHGHRSRSMPARLLADFEAALKDPELLSTRSDIAVLAARQEDLLRRVDSGEAGALWRQARAEWKAHQAAEAAGDRVAQNAAANAIDEVLGKGAADYMAWDELIRTTEQIRRLRESERKLLEAHQATMTAEQLAVLVAALTHSVRSHVKDMKVLDAIGRDVERLIAQPRSA